MQDIKQRREQIAQQLRDPRTQAEVIQRLKALSGFRQTILCPTGPQL